MCIQNINGNGKPMPRCTVVYVVAVQFLSIYYYRHIVRINCLAGRNNLSAWFSSSFLLIRTWSYNNKSNIFTSSESINEFNMKFSVALIQYLCNETNIFYLKFNFAGCIRFIYLRLLAKRASEKLYRRKSNKLTDISCSAMLSIHGNFGQRLIEYTASSCSTCKRATNSIHLYRCVYQKRTRKRASLCGASFVYNTQCYLFKYWFFHANFCDCRVPR